MPTTTTAPSRRRRASRSVKLGMAAAAALLLLPVGARACNEAAPAHGRPAVMLMTGIPLVWGEKGPF